MATLLLYERYLALLLLYGGYLARLLPCVYLAVLLSYNFGPRADCGFGLVCGYMWNLYVYGHIFGCSDVCNLCILFGYTSSYDTTYLLQRM